MFINTKLVVRKYELSYICMYIHYKAANAAKSSSRQGLAYSYASLLSLSYLNAKCSISLLIFSLPLIRQMHNAYVTDAYESKEELFGALHNRFEFEIESK